MGMSAELLLREFAVYGRFYEKRIAGVGEKLRDRLEIVPRDGAIADYVRAEPDLLVIMMNPGASRPLDALWDDAVTNDFVATLPDRTQYQIMSLMQAVRPLGMHWRHARVLNLSDLRTPKSAIFIEKLRQYDCDDSHSLFSEARRTEREDLFRQQRTPVLCAWGLSPHFGPLAQRALTAIAGHPLLGLSVDGLLFRHPLPQRFDLQQQWLARMQAQVAASCA